MKILLVQANTFRRLAAPPLGLAMIAEAARRAGHAVELLDLTFARAPDAALARALRRGPDLVGFSLHSLDDQNPRNPRSFVPDYRRWIAQANTVAPTIVGGPAFTAMPAALFSLLGASYGLAGQADRELVAFISELATGARRFVTPGVVWREGPAVLRNPPRLDGYGDRGSIPWSALDLARYRRGPVAAAVITKTGCAHRCLFCDATRCFGPLFAPREPERIVEDLRRDARDHQLNRYPYSFIDVCFNEPPRWAKLVLEAIARSGLRIRFRALLAPTATIDRELVGLLRRAGCLMVSCLLGSADDRVLAASRRPFCARDALAAFEIFEDFKLPYVPQLVFGGPGETQQTVEASLRFLDRIDPLAVQLDYGLRVYAGAALRDVAIAEGVIAADTDLIQPVFYLSPMIDRQQLAARLRRHRRWHPPRLAQRALIAARARWLRW